MQVLRTFGFDHIPHSQHQLHDYAQVSKEKSNFHLSCSLFTWDKAQSAVNFLPECLPKTTPNV